MGPTTTAAAAVDRLFDRFLMTECRDVWSLHFVYIMMLISSLKVRTWRLIFATLLCSFFGHFKQAAAVTQSVCMKEVNNCFNQAAQRRAEGKKRSGRRRQMMMMIGRWCWR